MWRLTSIFSEERVWGSEIIKMPLKPKAKNRTNAYNTRAVSTQRPLKMSILDNVYKTWSWRYLMKHVKDILLALISHNVFCIWSDGANIKPWFKTEGKKKKNHILIWVKKIFCSQNKISIVNSLCMCLLTSSGHQTHRGGGSWAETTVRTGYSAGGFLSAAVCCQTSASLVLAPAGSSSF